MSLYANVNNSKKEVTGLFGNVNGAKKEIVSLWANKDGAAVKVYDSVKQNIVCAFQFYSVSNGIYTVPIYRTDVESDDFQLIHVTIPAPFDANANYNAENFRAYKIGNRYFVIFGRTLYYSPDNVLEDGQVFIKHSEPLAPSTSYYFISESSQVAPVSVLYGIPNESNKLSMSVASIFSANKIVVDSKINQTGATQWGSYKTTRFGHSTSYGLYWYVLGSSVNVAWAATITLNSEGIITNSVVSGYTPDSSSTTVQRTFTLYRSYGDGAGFFKTIGSRLNGLSTVWDVNNYWSTNIPTYNDYINSNYKFSVATTNITTLYPTVTDLARYYLGYKLGSTSSSAWTVDGVTATAFVCMVNSYRVDSQKVFFVMKKSATAYAILKSPYDQPLVFETVKEITTPSNSYSILRFAVDKKK